MISKARFDKESIIYEKSKSILIDAVTYVMNTDGQPINGLFAAGEVTGGFHGTTRVDGSGTGDAIVFGRISGKAAAASVKNQRAGTPFF